MLNLETTDRNPPSAMGMGPGVQESCFYQLTSQTPEVNMFYCHDVIHLADMIVLIFFGQEEVTKG